MLIKLIFSPELKNNRGTLIYVLENEKCENWLVQFIPLQYEGNYEVKFNINWDPIGLLPFAPEDEYKHI